MANMLVYLPICLLGTLLYRFEQGKYSSRVLLSCLAILGVYLCTWPAPIQFILGWLITISLFLAIFAARARFHPAALVWCGRVSYSIYLLHGIPLWYSRGWGFPLVFLVAAIGYAVVEAPAIGLGQRITRRPALPAATL
jgi:peptidoglycan/LPS O-acetylase OafA/YrhL